MKKVLAIILTFFMLNISFAENIDMNLVRQTWVDWNNDVRKDLGLKPYIISDSLNTTATSWSNTALKRGDISHKRNTGDAYYDYNKITSWFANQGVEFENINRKTYSESIGRGRYTCSPDCTQGLIDGIRSTYKFFMSEKGKSYSPHYNAMVMPEFGVIGVGIVVDEKNKKYYLTAHYATSVEGEKINSTKNLALTNNQVSDSVDNADINPDQNLDEKISNDNDSNPNTNLTGALNLGNPVLPETINFRTPEQIAQAKDKLTNLLKIRITN